MVNRQKEGYFEPGLVSERKGSVIFGINEKRQNQAQKVAKMRLLGSQKCDYAKRGIR